MTNRGVNMNIRTALKMLKTSAPQDGEVSAAINELRRSVEYGLAGVDVLERLVRPQDKMLADRIRVWGQEVSTAFLQLAKSLSQPAKELTHSPSISREFKGQPAAKVFRSIAMNFDRFGDAYESFYNFIDEAGPEAAKAFELLGRKFGAPGDVESALKSGKIAVRRKRAGKKMQIELSDGAMDSLGWGANRYLAPQVFYDGLVEADGQDEDADPKIWEIDQDDVDVSYIYTFLDGTPGGFTSLGGSLMRAINELWDESGVPQDEFERAYELLGPSGNRWEKKYGYGFDDFENARRVIDGESVKMKTVTVSAYEDDTTTAKIEFVGVDTSGGDAYENTYYMPLRGDKFEDLTDDELADLVEKKYNPSEYGFDYDDAEFVIAR